MERPNILFILADDLGWGDVSWHGSRIQTPTLDRLAEGGVEFGQHYVCPVCTPTRASLLTGRYPGRFGAHATVPSNAPVLPDGYETLAGMLQNAGYSTGLFGKWHLGSQARFGPNEFGFDASYGSLAGGVDPYNHRYKRGEHSVTWHQDGDLIEARGHVTDLITEAALTWLDEQNSGQPWFCYVPYTAVHVPIKPTQEWLNHYADEPFDDDRARDASFRKYAAYTSHMDACIGELLEQIECMCQRENTLVVFSSDNGAVNDSPIHSTDKYPGWQEAYPLLGSNLPYRGVKAQLYEGGIRTPMVLNWRGTLEPGRLDAPLHIADWMPTLAGLTGAEPANDPQWDGQDFWPLIEGNLPQEERTIFWNYRQHQDFALRKDGWKLIERRRPEGTHRELFHVGQDPYEQHECAGKRPEVVEELAALIKAEHAKDDADKRTDVSGPGVS